ncbi:uncharacterized protein LOC118646172 isoform X1 [Monomorium pharaonis]|uniref:uncharacterized protein LOC118646172 isoform X1 n=1 Tax=Monomorium pharaonis TaxID=307658 RepID=UPI0017463A1D|nr:uncharacterized protein LOC118646172 isoform X1 [Monomorium pharaonis]
MGRKINGKRLHLSRPRRSTKKAWIKRILLCPTFSDARWMLAPYSVPCVWSSGSKSLLLAARLHSLARSAAPRFLCPRQAVSRLGCNRVKLTKEYASEIICAQTFDVFSIRSIFTVASSFDHPRNKVPRLRVVSRTAGTLGTRCELPSHRTRIPIFRLCLN